MSNHRERSQQSSGGARDGGTFAWYDVMKAADAERIESEREDRSRAGVIVWAAIGWLVFAAGVAGLCYWIGTRV